MKAIALFLLFCSSAFAAVTQTESTWDRYQGTAKKGSHATREACVAAVPVGTTQTCRFRVTVKNTADPVTPPLVTWAECAREGGTCTFAGRRELRYTAAAGASVRQITKVGESPVACTDAAFGAAATTYENVCSVSSVTTTAPITIVSGTTPPVTPPVTPPSTGTAGPRVSTFTDSGPITATAGQVISGKRISNPNGACVTISGVSGVILRDNEIGPCGGAAVNVVNGATGNTVEHNRVSADIERGIIVVGAAGNTVQKNTMFGVRRVGDYKHAVEVTRSDRTKVIGNVITGAWRSDIISGYESSDCEFTDNEFNNVSIDEPTGASFTIGDSTTGNPGRNNYIARNMVRSQSGGVPAGVFGSAGNTVLEYNCFAAGIQAYNYSGTFVGVTVQKNVINMGNSFVPDSSVIAGWSTNVDSTNCALVPQ